MKQLIILLLFLCLTAPAAYFLRPFYYKIVKHLTTQKLTFTNNTFHRDLHYRLYIPKIKNGIRYPLVVTLHGAAERGSDNLKQIDGIASTFISRKVQRKYPAFVLMPQCPEGTQWLNTGFTKTPFGHYRQASIPESPEMKMVIMVIQQLIATHPIDTSRIYAGGFSMGASGTWDIITRHPDLFAAAFMMSGVSDTSTAEKLVHIPIRAFTGALDDIAPPSLNRDMCDAISKNGGISTFTLYENTGHYCVHEAMKEPGFIEWIFLQQKK